MNTHRNSQRTSSSLCHFSGSPECFYISNGRYSSVYTLNCSGTGVDGWTLFERESPERMGDPVGGVKAGIHCCFVFFSVWGLTFKSHSLFLKEITKTNGLFNLGLLWQQNWIIPLGYSIRSFFSNGIWDCGTGLCGHKCLSKTNGKANLKCCTDWCCRPESG